MPYVIVFSGAVIALYLWNIIGLTTLKVWFFLFVLVFIVGPLVYKHSYTIQRSSIFLNYVTIPYQPNCGDPSKCGLRGALNFYLNTDDGVTLGVWHIVPEDLIESCDMQDESHYRSVLNGEHDIIIYNHGNSGNRSAPHRIELYNVLRKNFHVITFDYRSYGDSSNVVVSEMGAVRDSMCVYKWVRNLTSANIFVWGHSLGTAISTHMVSLVEEMSPKGLILESPFNNMRDEIGKHQFAKLFRSLPWFTYTVLDPVYENNLQFKTDEHIGNVHCPIMMLHAKDDGIVPYALGLKLYRETQEKRSATQGKLYFHSFEKDQKYGHKYICRAPELIDIVRTLYVAWKNMILSYNTRTSKRLKTLRGLDDPIVDFSLHFFKGAEVLTACSVSGKIICWKIDIGVRFLKLCIPLSNATIESFKFFEEVDERFCKFLFTWSTASKVHCSILNTEHTKIENIPLDLKTDSKRFMALCDAIGSQYAAIVQENQMHFIVLSRKPRVYRHCIDYRKHFTCVACSPTEECVITGNSIGQILVWYNLTHKYASRASYHWHSLPVRCLSFSSSGTDFYSGGGERVLVKWHMDNSYERNYLPRLSSTLEQITVSSENQYIAVGTGDNGIQVLDSAMNVVSIIQHLVLNTTFSGGIVFDQRTKSLILNGITGHLQFYSPHDLSLLYNLDIVNQNQMPQEADCHIESTNVTKFACNYHGSWLATVEERPDVDYSFELRLKFWEFNTVKQIFELNTSIELPHRKSISDILFEPVDNPDLKCVTVGGDKQYKIWQVANADTIYRKAKVWNCIRVGFYRELPCQGLSFSFDGSLIGIGFGPLLTTWSPDTCELRCSLVHPQNRETLIALQFGISKQCHLVVTITENHLSVWNLLTLCMNWTVPIQAAVLVPNPFDTHMAVFTRDKKLFVFNPDSTTPLFMQDTNDEVLASIFVPLLPFSDMGERWCQKSQLFFITTKQVIFITYHWCY
ncbi:hypothetical protein FQA39_LY12697 [Lamprigera yunnana]|nr:hypothetical protein FQA39_LY12697 [Lamprigera yunnana]